MDSLIIEIDWRPDRRKLRRFALGLAAGAAAAGWLMVWRAKPAGYWLGAAGLSAGALSWVWPAAGLWVYRIWMGAAFALTAAAQTIFLAAAYYGIVTPLALLMRVLGRDALRLKNGRRQSEWTPLREPDDENQYERLY